MNTINNFAQQLEGLPGYDLAVDWINDKAGEKYQTKDPFYVEIHGKKKRRKAPETCSKKEQQAWKRIKKRAWLDDKNFFGCYPIDLGLGLAPLLALIPVIGPLLMFAIHGRLVSIADQEFHLPPSTVTKMHGNIGFDLLISLPPILGSLFSWMNGCSTRNAALVHTYLVKRERAKEEQRLQQMNLSTTAPDNLSGVHSFNSQPPQQQRPQKAQQLPNGAAISQPPRAQQPPAYHQGQYKQQKYNRPHHSQQQQPYHRQGGTTVKTNPAPIKKPPPSAYQAESIEYAQSRGRQF